MCEEMSPPPQPVDLPDATPPSASDPTQKPGLFSPHFVLLNSSFACAGFS